MLLSSIMSCSTTKFKVKSNNKATDKAITSFLIENENAFYLRSTYSTESTVWSYTKEYILIKRIVNGKEELKKEPTSFELEKYFQSIGEIKFEFDDCMELDGDLFGFQFTKYDNLEEGIFPVNINCIIKKSYVVESANNLMNEINRFKLWNIR